MTIWHTLVAALAFVGAFFLLAQGIWTLNRTIIRVKRHYRRKAILLEVRRLMERRKLYGEVLAEIRRICAVGYKAHDNASGFGWWQGRISESGWYGDTLIFDVSKMGLALRETQLIAGMLDKRRGDVFDRLRGPTAWMPRGRKGHLEKDGYYWKAHITEPLVAVKHVELSGNVRPFLVA